MTTDNNNVASMNPADFIAGGLLDDFDGRITRARLVPWDYNGNADHFSLAVALTIQPDEGNEFTQYYSAGSLEHFVPSMDSKVPVNLDAWTPQRDPDDNSVTNTAEVEGVFAYKVGKRAQLNNNTNYAHFLGKLVELNFDPSNITPDIRFLEGIYGHFDRIPQQERNLKNQKERKTAATILVLTSLKDAPPAAKAPAKSGGVKTSKSAPIAATTTPAATTATAPATDGLDAQLQAVILELLANNDGTIAKGALLAQVSKSFDGAAKSAVIRRVTDGKFLANANNGWTLTDNGNTLTLG